MGSFGGGRFADSNAGRTLIVGSIGVAASLLTLYLVGAIAVLVALALLASGVFAMGMAPSLQYRVVSLAGPGGAFAQSLPASAANLGIAFGSLRRRRGDRRLHRLRRGDHRPGHRRDRHPGRLGDQLPEATDGRCGRGADSRAGPCHEPRLRSAPRP